MPLSLAANQLLSRVIRWNASEGRFGASILNGQGNASVLSPQPRKIFSLSRVAESRDSQGNFLGWLFDTGRSLIGFIGKILGAVGFSITAAWGWLIGRIEQLKAFNWNATDQALTQMIDSRNVALASIWGSVVGAGLGWAVGIGVGYGIGFFCPVVGGSLLAKTIAGNVTAEALEETLALIRTALLQTAGALANATLINGYIQFRRMLKAAPLPLLERLFGAENADFIKREWGAEGGPDLSFNTQMDELVESIDNNLVQAFVEELLEESYDAFLEAGFVIAQDLDDAFQQLRAANKAIDGTQRTIEIAPDNRAEDEETLTFEKVPQRLLIPSIQTTINTHRLIHNRDVGLLMGMPLDEYAKAKPQGLRIVIDMYSVPSPPFFRTQNDDFVWATITIPDAKIAALSWEQIKAAVGGPNGYLWGRFRAMATLDNGRRMMVYGGSEVEAEQRLRAMLLLSNAEMLSLTITEEKREGERLTRPRLYKQTTRVYPGNFTVINRKELLDPNSGRATLRGNYRDAKVKIPLWTAIEPPNVVAKINSVLRTGL